MAAPAVDRPQARGTGRFDQGKTTYPDSTAKLRCRTPPRHPLTKRVRRSTCGGGRTNHVVLRPADCRRASEVDCDSGFPMPPFDAPISGIGGSGVHPSLTSSSLRSVRIGSKRVLPDIPRRPLRPQSDKTAGSRAGEIAVGIGEGRFRTANRDRRVGERRANLAEKWPRLRRSRAG